MGALEDAAAKGDRELLIALRTALARELDAGVPARELASVSRRLMEIRREISDLDARNPEVDVIAELAALPDMAWTPPGGSSRVHDFEL